MLQALRMLEAEWPKDPAQRVRLMLSAYDLRSNFVFVLKVGLQVGALSLLEVQSSGCFEPKIIFGYTYASAWNSAFLNCFLNVL